MQNRPCSAPPKRKVPVRDSLVAMKVAQGPPLTDWAFSNGNEHSRQAWYWRCPTGISAKPFLLGIQPWLRVKQAQCANALAMIELMARSRKTLGPYKMPPEWIDAQENLYWIKRKLNHRGSAEFVKPAMHSPRRISRERAQAATYGV